VPRGKDAGRDGTERHQAIETSWLVKCSGCWRRRTPSDGGRDGSLMRRPTSTGTVSAPVRSTGGGTKWRHGWGRKTPVRRMRELARDGDPP
jgi:hypothetical protein